MRYKDNKNSRGRDVRKGFNKDKSAKNDRRDSTRGRDNERRGSSSRPTKQYRDTAKDIPLKKLPVNTVFDDDGDMHDEIIYGKNAVTELLKSGNGVDTVFISDNLNESVAAYFAALAKDCGAVVKTVHPNKLNAMTHDGNHQGIAAYRSSIEYTSVDDMLDIALKKEEAPFIILCDGIEDPHNLGAIMRSAYLIGAHGIIIPKRGGVGITSVVHKTSAGASMHLPVARVANIAQEVRNLKAKNVFVYCADMSDRPLYQQNLTGAIALVVGSEGKGVQPLVKSLCDGVVTIPMSNAGTGVDSYNASVAAGIIMYEISRQRNIKK